MKTIYQTSNTLQLGDNNYPPYTTQALTTYHPAQWFACCVQGQGQSNFIGHYWNGTAWTNDHSCTGDPGGPQDVVGPFAVKLNKDGFNDPESYGTPSTWFQAAFLGKWQEEMCENSQDSMNVYQKKLDVDLRSTAEDGATIESDDYSFHKPMYSDSDAKTLASTAMYMYGFDFHAYDSSADFQEDGGAIYPSNGELEKCSSKDKGCIFEGTLVKLVDGSNVKVEELWENHKKGISCKLWTKENDNILNSDKPLELEAWNYSGDITWKDGSQRIITILQYDVDALYEFQFHETNDVLKTSWDHWNLIMRNTNDWSYKRSCELNVGDYLPSYSGGNLSIKSIEIKYGVFNVYRVDVGGNNLFIANNVLTHNASDDGGDGEKKGGR